MDHAVALQYINAFGFPVCVSIALGYVLWKIGSRLLDSLYTIGLRLVEAHFDLVNTVKSQGETTVKELQVQSDILSKLPSDFTKVMACKINSVAEVEALARSVASHVHPRSK